MTYHLGRGGACDSSAKSGTRPLSDNAKSWRGDFGGNSPGKSVSTLFPEMSLNTTQGLSQILEDLKSRGVIGPCRDPRFVSRYLQF